MNDDVNSEPAGPGAVRPSRRASRAVRVAAAILPAVLVLGAAGGGIAYIAATAGHAATKAPTPLWGKGVQPERDDPVAHPGEGRQDTVLSKMLLPANGRYRLGPDIGEYDHDAELTAKQAEAVVKGAGKGLSGSWRTEWNRKVEGWGVRGMGMRTYASDDDSLVAEVQLARIRDKKEVRSQFTTRMKLFKAAGAVPGPKIDGHRSDSGCFLPPKGLRSGLRTLDCFGYRGDVLVTFNATFTEASYQNEAVALVGRQLDYLTTPGESV
ncbi:hypothetical protein [Streptomyces sp. NPDC059398]|uniref:hypothetical protein n=1 Tax=Streptomyces sp. NPDC059398 TaxID=3346820 RepID=UPI003684014D